MPPATAILRRWTGLIRTAEEAEYLAYVERTGGADYGATPGNLGFEILFRARGDGTSEVTTLSTWESEAAIRAFAGDDPTKARYYPEDDRFLLSRPERVEHHRIATARKPAPGTRVEPGDVVIGRLMDHVHLRARDLEATKRFYRAVLGALALPFREDAKHLDCDELWIDALPAGTPETHLHLAFQASDEDMVRRFHEAGLAAGGRDNGAPGPRDYAPGYFAAFLLDPDGNNIEAVTHGPRRRSAAAILISPAPEP